MKTTALLLRSLVCLAMFGACEKVKDNSCDAPLPDTDIPVPFSIITDSVEPASGSVECRTKEVEFGPEWKEFVSLDPQSSAIWIGGGLSFPSVKTGAYTPVSGDRKPITISVSLPGISGNAGRKIENPSLSSTRTAMNEILQQQVQGSATPAQIAWSKTEIYNERHFKLAIGGNYGNLFYDINAQYNYKSNEVIGRFLFQFTQVYYSVDCDAPPAGISNFYQTPPSCTNASLGGYSPVYVSSVKYGRKVFLIIESKTYDYSHMADIQASFDAFFSNGGVSMDLTLSKLMQEQSIKGVIIGGPSYEGIKVINNISSLKEYLLKGANFSLSSPGVPLSYTLRFMRDNSIASVIQYDKFKIRECMLIPPNVTTTTLTPADINEVRLFLTRGDQEFAGHGPDVKLTVSLALRNSKTEVWAIVKVEMKETEEDWTTGSNVFERKIYTAPSGKKILSAGAASGGSVSDELKYRDISVSADVFSLSQPSRLIKYASFLGDTHDDDITNSNISASAMEQWGHLHTLKLNPIKVVITD